MKKSRTRSSRMTMSLAALACVAVLPAAASAGNPLVFKINNASSYTLTEVHLSPSLEDNWSHDVLGKGGLAAGAAADVSIAGRDKTCLYDMRFVAADGSLLEEIGVDLCTLDSYTLNP